MLNYLLTLSHRSIGNPSPAQHDDGNKLFNNQAFIYDRPIMSASILALGRGVVAHPSAFRRLTNTTTAASRLSRGFADTSSTSGISDIPSMFSASKSGPQLGELGKLANLAEMVNSLKAGQEELINAMKNLSAEIETQKEEIKARRVYVLETAKEEGEFGMVDNVGEVKLTALGDDQFHFLDRVFHEPLQMVEKVGGIKTVNKPAFVILAPSREQLEASLELAKDGILQTPAIVRMCETHISSPLPELLDAGETFKAQIRLIAGEIANIAVDGQVFTAESDDDAGVSFLTEYNGSMTDPRFDDCFVMREGEAERYTELYAQYREDTFHPADHRGRTRYTPGYNVRFYFHSPVEGPCQVEGWQEWAMRMQVDEEGATDTEVFGDDVTTFNCPVYWQADLPFKLDLSGTVLDIETDADGPYFTLANEETAAEDCEPQNVVWSAELP
ncbi:uncharacterized protein IAS62_005758 [Cryptococcus decagattii]|uniref:Uncharacterized protein n=1 Tax=Cryptococcus decagattii TaxID=1859122 RepID=A0ABZ2B451_9TREE